jgi:hypothetical protein
MPSPGDCNWAQGLVSCFQLLKVPGLMHGAVRTPVSAVVVRQENCSLVLHTSTARHPDCLLQVGATSRDTLMQQQGKPCGHHTAARMTNPTPHEAVPSTHLIK